MTDASRMQVIQDTYIFSARVTPSNLPGRTVTVAFFATSKRAGSDLGSQLRDFFARNALSSELWLVGPSYVADDLRRIRDSASLTERLEHAAKLDAVRVVVFDHEGVWAELDNDADRIVDTKTAQQVRDEGLKVMFCEGGGLMQAHAGLHYAKPSGGHTQSFLRAGPVLARSPLTYFAAAALLPWASQREYSRIWVDTNAIAGVGFALSALQSAFSGVPTVTSVDSFGGHVRLAKNPPNPADQPLILISASTSGGLAGRITELYGVPLDDIATLFFVGLSPMGTVLCDLTRTSADDADEYKIDPIPTWSEESCDLCQDGLITVSLEGEDFVPEATRATTRMLKAEYGSQQLSDFMNDFVGHGAIRVGTSHGASPGESRSVDVRLADALQDSESPIRARVVRELKLALPGHIRWIVTLSDPDSNAVAEIAKELCDLAGLNTAIIGATELDEKTELSGGHAFVVAGTVASGRSLLNISRQLRYLHKDHIHYFIVCARPRGSASWKSFKSDLQYGERPSYYPLRSIWTVDNEPDRRDQNSWALELELLRRADASLRREPSNGERAPELASLETRMSELTRTSEDDSAPLTLFPTPSYGVSDDELQLNPNFAFWRFQFKDLDRFADGRNPSQAEVFFTMSAVLHAFRYSKEGRYALFGIPGHGYVLDPMNFGRFNDPIIQGSILRAARGMELDYSSHEETSAIMTDQIVDILAARDDLGKGGAATEFALAIARGVTTPTSPGALRLAPADLERVLAFADEVDHATSPLLSALLQYTKLSTTA